MPFIFTDRRGKSEPAKRLLIRRHVMLGKNRGKTRKPPTAHRVDFSLNPELPPVHNRNRLAGPPPDLTIDVRYPHIPDRVGWEMSLTRFAISVEQPLLRDLLQFCLAAKRIMYPLQQCIRFHNEEDKADSTWLKLLTTDDAYMHATVFASQAYVVSTSRDGERSSMAARQAVMHHTAALRLLRQRLAACANNAATISDATILVVLCLTLHAQFAADAATATLHMQGLYKIVHLRGGLAAFRHNTKLIIELLKCDLGIALNNKTRPLFRGDPIVSALASASLRTTQAAATTPPDAAPAATDCALPSLQGVHADLRRIWTTLHRFCATVNTAVQRKRQLPKDVLLDAMASTMYPLLDLNGAFAAQSVDEAICLGLLVFSAHIFLSWQGLRPAHTHFPGMYRACLVHTKLPDTFSPLILVWLLLFGSLTLFSPADNAWLMPWLRLNIGLCRSGTWRGLCGQLETLPWIGMLHDKPGKVVYDTAVQWPQVV
ncbi:hypothetical protein SPI_08061 [Niveomyces insectorum RCEF 264]|uniref:Rhodanese domain-containing protein n=1 Tax=Niveomyces insectorum RCEF 264 TaxID=1081102 RepID=A0A167NS28_9HYPO|nr:hypothetical protein SPI_08061 [Niveomyces insectorum RCEF 264]